ncbi:hypothetical protein EUGRSUZ_C03091 [Eucalyptus grandis]|uniref:Uncharacterized protein n=2 Tax=Eucalyptus grandis TaxID=71139 RepID=A0ACC3LHG7_EUCGR|nr:hypothetical protein EUGRSUZ_C03091 [Eucalyptus grandis]
MLSSAHNVCPMVLTKWELTNQPCPSFAWKYVTLQLRLIKWYLPGISSLLRNSHFLERLAIYVYPGRACQSRVYWCSVDSTFPYLEDQLKHVKIYGYVLEPDVIELIEFLLKNAQILEKMEISTKKTLQRTEFSQKLLSFPRASTRAVIHLG